MALDTKDKSAFVAAVRAVVLSLLPNLRFMGDHEYSVATMNTDTVDMRPVDTSAGLPPLAKVPFRGASGVAGKLQAGTRVVVRFINSDPGRPYVAGVIGANDGAFLPTELRVDTTGKLKLGENAGLVEIAGGAQWLALANLVKAEIQALATTVSLHTHTGNGAAPDAWAHTVGDVKAEKVKGT